MAMGEQDDSRVCEHLNIPGIPKKKWDGQRSFKHGVAEITLLSGRMSYAVATYDRDKDTDGPRIIKVFDGEPFVSVGDIYVVPDYMNDDVDTFDLEQEDKERAQALLDEARALETEGTENPRREEDDGNEYIFDFIHNDDEARAYIESYNRTNKVKGRVPKTHEALVMRLAVIRDNQKKKRK